MKDIKDDNLNVNSVNLEMNQINFNVKNKVIYTILLKQRLNQIIFRLFFENCLDSKSLWHSIDKILHRSHSSQ